MKKMVIAAAVMALCAPAAWAEKIAYDKTAHVAVSDVWSRATPPGHTMSGAVYLTLTNIMGKDDALINAATPRARMVQIHRTTTNDMGHMSMDEMEKVVLADQTKVMLMPGDVHIMLMGLDGPLVAGTEFPLELTFENSPAQTVKVHVKRITYRPGADEAPHGHAH